MGTPPKRADGPLDREDLPEVRDWKWTTQR
jgi:hypothetical protein